VTEPRTCRFLGRYVAPGRDHVYFLCNALDEPYIPTAEDLAGLCRGACERCPRHAEAEKLGRRAA
jgi:hypothetical protein